MVGRLDGRSTRARSASRRASSTRSGARCTTDELVVLARAAGDAAASTPSTPATATSVLSRRSTRRSPSPNGAACRSRSRTSRRAAARPTARCADVLERIDAARADGLDVACDQHTRHPRHHQAGHDVPAVGLGGRRPTSCSASLRDPASARRVPRLPRADPQARADGRVGSPGAVRGAGDRRSSVGKDFATIGRERGQHPLDAMMDILLEAGEDAPNVLFVGLVQTQEDLDLDLRLADLLARIGRDDAGDGRAAGRPALPRRLHLGGVLPAPHRPRAPVADARGGRPAPDRDARRRVGLRDRGVLAPGRLGRRHVFDPDDGRRARHGREPNAFAVGIHAGVRQRPARVRRAETSPRSTGGAGHRAGARRMSRRETAMTIMTVLGPIEDDQLGVTQPHEHLLDQPVQDGRRSGTTPRSRTRRSRSRSSARSRRPAAGRSSRRRPSGSGASPRACAASPRRAASTS